VGFPKARFSGLFLVCVLKGVKCEGGGPKRALEGVALHTTEYKKTGELVIRRSLGASQVEKSAWGKGLNETHRSEVEVLSIRREESGKFHPDGKAENVHVSPKAVKSNKFCAKNNRGFPKSLNGTPRRCNLPSGGGCKIEHFRKKNLSEVLETMF